MKYKKINGKNVSQISLGTVQLGMNYGIANIKGQPTSEEAFKIMSAALNNGITAFDTASAYGNSEEIIGNFLAGWKSSKPFITTKYLSFLEDEASYNLVEKELFKSVDNSLSRLKVPMLDCLLLHRPNDMTRHGNYLIKALEKLVINGIIGCTGVSVYNDSEIDTMLNYEIFQNIQLPMNIFDISLIKNGYISKLANKNINVFVRSVFFQGLFFLNSSNIENNELSILVSKHLDTLKHHADNENMSIAQLALSYIRDTEGVLSLVLGADNEKQVLENIKLANAPSINEKTKQAIEKEFSNIDVSGIMKILAKTK